VTPFLLPRAIRYAGNDQEHKLAAILPGIEAGLLLPAAPIAELAPLEARFRAAVRATLERLIAQEADCEPGNAHCARALARAPAFLRFGDAWQGAGMSHQAVWAWAQGIALFDKL